MPAGHILHFLKKVLISEQETEGEPPLPPGAMSNQAKVPVVPLELPVFLWPVEVLGKATLGPSSL